MKIQLKRSNQLESGAAKEPTAGQMEYGELAVNYNNDDPAIFLKTSTDEVIRISGIGSIADDGQVELPSSQNPPTNPSPGNLWFNSEDGRLYIYYKDVDTEQWVDASPDSWNPSDLPDFDNPNVQPDSNFDQRYVNAVGDNMTGDLTLGTDKITLGATSGSASFSSRVQADIPDDSTEYAFNGLIRNETSGRSVYTARHFGTDESTSPNWQGLSREGSITSQIFSDGSATFANDGLRIQNDGELQLGGTTAAPNMIFKPNGAASIGGTLDVYNKFSVNSQDPNVAVLSGNLDDVQTTYIAASGSADFAGAVRSTSDGLSYCLLQPVGNLMIRSVVDLAFGVEDRNNGNALNAQIKRDGSATFAGTIYSGGTGVFTGADLGSSIGYEGNAGFCCGSTSSAIRVYTQGNSTPTVDIKADGSATFDKTVVSYEGFSATQILGYGVVPTTFIAIGSSVPGSVNNTASGTGIYQYQMKIDGDVAGYNLRFVGLRNGDSPINVFTINQTGGARSSNFIIETEPDNDANYVTTTEEYTETESYTGPLGNTLEREVTKTREVSTYTGPTLDIKDHLTRTQVALTSLKTAAQDSATDLAGLKAAIVSALANI